MSSEIQSAHSKTADCEKDADEVSRQTPPNVSTTLKRLIEETEFLLALNFFGICGSMGRNGLVQLTAFEHLGSVWPNVCGCFVMAVTPGLFGPTLSGAIGTGFCGAMSSFSELITDIFSESTTPKPNWPDHGYGVPLFMARLILEMSCCFASYLAGGHATSFLKDLGLKKMSSETELIIRRLCEALGVAAWVVCLVTTITSHNWVRWWPLCGVFAPFGVWLRYYFSKLNSEKKWFKMGTFLANALATVVACVCVLCLKLPSISPVQTQVVTGFQRGFTGCLSTISTFVKEMNTMKTEHGYMYGIISLFVGYAFAFIIVGSYIWTR